ncbi:MAG: ATP-binding protein [Candidatus Helarchaeota archaeon]
MISIFINRENELKVLENEWKKDSARFIIIYGRRRIGKTRLIMEFIKDKKGIFYIAEDSSKIDQINGLKERIALFTQDDLLFQLEIKDWNQLFDYITKILPNERFYLIIDEFSYIIKNGKEILSIIQKYWDLYLKNTNIFLILSGSMLGLMSEKVLSYTSPLYGRRNKDLLIESLNFKNSEKFLQMPFLDALETYFIIGGIPEYLIKASEYNSLKDFLEHEFFNKFGYFYREPYFIISQEFKEIRIYFSILKAISLGNTRPTKIANYVGINAREIYPYLENLSRMGFIERITPLIGNTKKGIYLIKDNIFDFWFNFVSKYREQIELENFNIKNINEEIKTFLGKKFEKFILKEIIHQLFPDSDKIGKWWYKDIEIDAIAINEKLKTIAFIEVKWSSLNSREANNILNKLKKKANQVKWKNDDRKEIFGLIAYKIENKKQLIKNGYIVKDIEDLERYKIFKN